MKSIITLLSLLISLSISAQFEIPNGDFEDWQFNGWNFFPVDWQTNNTQLTQDVFQDSAAYEGELAMRVEAVNASVGSQGEASIEIPTGAIPPSLDFYAKWHRTPTASISVEVTFFNEDMQFSPGTGYWTPEDTISDWVPISIPLTQFEPVLTHAVIRVSAYVGDFAPGEGWISVDAMSIGGVTVLEENEEVQFSVYPNPATDLLIIDYIGSENEVDRIRMFDMSGRRVLDRAASTELDVSALPIGRYELEVVDREGVAVMSKGVVVE